MRLRRSHVPVIEDTHSIDPGVEQELRLAEAVGDFRQRLHTDADFRQSFGNTIKEAFARAQANAVDEVEARAEEYGGNTVLGGNELTPGAKAAKAHLVDSLIGLLRSVATDQQFGVAGFMRELRGHVGEAVNDTYAEGLKQLDPAFTLEGTVGVVHPELGWIVAIERLDTIRSVAELQADSRLARKQFQNFIDTQGGM